MRPLTKTPKGKDIADTDTFCINESFSHEKRRVKINAIQLKETKEENRETHERVAADRAFETQAAIVRIMKGAKTMTHAQLVAEVIRATQSRGVLGVPDIKKNIDKLIEKGELGCDVVASGQVKLTMCTCRISGAEYGDWSVRLHLLKLDAAEDLRNVSNAQPNQSDARASGYRR